MLWISWHCSVLQGWGSQRMHFPFLRALFSAIIYSHHPLQFGSLPTLEGSVGRAVIPLLPRISGSWKSQKEKGGNFRFPCLSNFQGDLRSSKRFLDWQGRSSCKRKVTPCIPCGKIFFLWSCGSEWVELEKPHKKSMHELCRLNNTVIGSITPSLNYPQLLGMGTVQVTASAWIPGSRFGTSLSFLSSSSLQKEPFCCKIWGGSSWNLFWGDAERDHWGWKGKGSRAEQALSRRGLGEEGGTTRGWFSSTPKGCVWHGAAFERLLPAVLPAGSICCGPGVELGSPGWEWGCADAPMPERGDARGAAVPGPAFWAPCMSSRSWGAVALHSKSLLFIPSCTALCVQPEWAPSNESFKFRLSYMVFLSGLFWFFFSLPVFKFSHTLHQWPDTQGCSVVATGKIVHKSTGTRALMCFLRSAMTIIYS